MAGIVWRMTAETQAPPSAPPWVPSDATFAARLAMIRHQLGWNLKEAARACAVPAQSWRQWEIDGMLPRNQVTVAKQIAGAAGCDYLWLLAGPEGRGGKLTRGADHGRVVAPAGRPGSAAARGAVVGTRPIVRRQQPAVAGG